MRNKIKIIYFGIKESENSNFFLNEILNIDSFSVEKIILSSVKKNLKSKSIINAILYLLNRLTFIQIIFYLMNIFKEKNYDIEKYKDNILISNNQKIIYDSLKQIEFDYIFVYSFFFKLNKKILSLPNCGAINFHNGDITKFRSEHPIETSILFDNMNNKITAHCMTDIYDFGEIVFEKEYTISDCATIQGAHYKSNMMWRETLRNFPNILDYRRQNKKESKHLLEKGSFKKINFYYRNVAELILLKNFLLNCLLKIFRKSDT